MARGVARHHELIDDAVRRTAASTQWSRAKATASSLSSPGSDAVAAAATPSWPGAEPGRTVSPLGVRMAIHTGEAGCATSATTPAPAVIRCARLRALGPGGQVLVSGATADLVGRPPARRPSLVDLGVHRLKDLGRPSRSSSCGHPDLPADFPPLRSLDAIPQQPARRSCRRSSVGTRHLPTVRALLDRPAC